MPLSVCLSVCSVSFGRSSTVAGHTYSSRRLCALADSFIGVLLGLSPLGKILVNPSAAEALITPPLGGVLPTWDVSILLKILTSMWETVEMLATATLTLQVIVLATSLFGKPAGAATAASPAVAAARAEGMGGISNSDTSSLSGFSNTSSIEVLDGDDSIQTTIIVDDHDAMLQPAPVITLTTQEADSADDASASVLNQLLPYGELEWRMVTAVAAVRFLLLPMFGLGLVLTMSHFGLLPADSACILALLLQGAMPPAQNLVLMMQLQPSTAELAAPTARLLLQLYTIAVAPITVWVAVFVSAAARATAAL